MAEKPSPFELLQDIGQRCRSLATSLPAHQETAQSWSGIGFRLGQRYFVAPMGEVTEVLHEPGYTRIPRVKPWVRGVANVRGRLLPIIDLLAFLGEPAPLLRKKRRILVLEYEDLFAGLIVDEVFGIQHFLTDSFTEDYPGAAPSLQPFVHGTFLREQPWWVFSPHTLGQHPEFLKIAA